ncbi:hypothetical protein [Metallibacterium sp.]|uniref:hypothetical protein n=1 Tax=Metallibacterium sp. TaxID=2940281 RepID=UPI00263729A5|nr:hypothetical protein [Metallibacterium sp.]
MAKPDVHRISGTFARVRSVLSAPRSDLRRPAALPRRESLASLRGMLLNIGASGETGRFKPAWQVDSGHSESKLPLASREQEAADYVFLKTAYTT